MLRKNIILVCFTGLGFILSSQVPKKVVVEHFTNTLCSVCASRNPGFRSNLQTHDSILYISYHPSSPYANCIFYKHNVRENDGRTRFYGLYGSTPRLSIQGTIISASANYASASIFAPYLGKTSPVEIKIQQYKSGSSGILSRVVIKTVATHSYTSARLYVALAEDTIDYNAPNGEKTHYHVFRKALTDSNGVNVSIASKVGDSVVLNFSSPVNPAWDIGKIMHVAILQESGNKQVIQAEISVAQQNDQKLGVKIYSTATTFNIYPNPVRDVLYIRIPENPEEIKVEIVNILGETIILKQLSGLEINLVELPDGLYHIRIQGLKTTQVLRFLKKSGSD